MSRDDIVIRPRLGGPTAASTPVQARMREETVRGKADHNFDLLGRLMRSTGQRAAAGGFGLARLGRLARAGGIVAGAIVAGAVAARLATGRSFENMGAAINDATLGNLDENARANRDARELLAGDREIARIVGREGRVNSQVRSLFRDFRELSVREHRGRKVFELDQQFQVQNMADHIVVGFKDALVQAWMEGRGNVVIGLLRRWARGGTSR